jgi:hypothetical protein
MKAAKSADLFSNHRTVFGLEIEGNAVKLFISTLATCSTFYLL